MNEIAIASIPVQMWEQPYEVPEALQQGTIFPGLYKPFFIVDKMKKQEAAPKSQKEALLLEIQEVSFALTDITLYLDTHPEEQKALDYREACRTKRKQLLTQFAKTCYPLTPDCQGLWPDGPIPWEGVCQDVVL